MQQNNSNWIIPKIKYGYMASPALINSADVKTFKHTKEEKALLLTMKYQNKMERKNEFGDKWKLHLNTTANKAGFEKPLKFTF